MDENANKQSERELTIDEIVEAAMDALGFGPEVMTCCEPDGCFCDMEPAELELARASIAYLAFQLLLMHRIKHGNVRGNPGGWVGVRHYESEIRKDIARVLDVRGTQAERTGEVRRLYKVASRAWNEDESYRDRLACIMQGFEEEYGLDSSELGIVFI
ncbi:MAG: hypothetical protein IJ087_00785 [Eggerthellaceae bacterium]|nr:hypothetical protein [Eggerthellaceae bacterium]